MADIDIWQLLDVMTGVVAEMGVQAYETDDEDLGLEADHLESCIEYYKMGMVKTIPLDWEKYVNRLDAEYGEYLRLKAKFEND